MISMVSFLAHWLIYQCQFTAESQRALRQRREWDKRREKGESSSILPPSSSQRGLCALCASAVKGLLLPGLIEITDKNTIKHMGKNNRIYSIVGADLCVCPGGWAYTESGADT
jgi:hypothetical protein